MPILQESHVIEFLITKFPILSSVAVIDLEVLWSSIVAIGLAYFLLQEIECLER